MLERALKLASNGYSVFPLQANSKIPAVRDWENWATTSPKKIKNYWGRSPESNIGLATGPSDLVVLDIDVKGDKNGFETLEAVAPEFLPAFEDNIVTTPSGGLHVFYSRNGDELKNTAGAIAEGIDTRAIGGYVVAPGSKTADGPYDGLLNPRSTLKSYPEWFKVQKAPIKDLPESEAEAIDVDRAIHYLESQDGAVEGANGDHQTYGVACQLRDYGLPKESAYGLMLTHYNPKCSPPWTSAELKLKIDNAYRYAQNSVGAKTIHAQSIEAQKASETPSTPLKATRASDLNFIMPKRDWILGTRLITDYVTVTIAPGGVGKSMYTMVEAVAVATGKPLLGEVPHKTGDVIIYNTEDPLDEIQRRVLAICMQYNIDLKELNRLHILSGIDDPIRVAKTVRGGTVVTGDASRLDALVKETNAVVVLIDPFIRTHSVEENDNSAIDTVVQCFSKIAMENHCAVSLVHHTNKQSSQTGAGDMNSARGASALASACRIASTLTTMTTKEADIFGLKPSEAPWYIRIDNAKGNMSAPATAVNWVRKESVTLPNGDSVGTLAPADMSGFLQSKEEKIKLKAQAMHYEIYSQFGIGVHALSQVTDWILSIAPDGESKSTVRRQLIDGFEDGVYDGDIKIAYGFSENRRPKHYIQISNEA